MTFLAIHGDFGIFGRVLSGWPDYRVGILSAS